MRACRRQRSLRDRDSRLSSLRGHASHLLRQRVRHREGNCLLHQRARHREGNRLLRQRGNRLFRR